MFTVTMFIISKWEGEKQENWEDTVVYSFKGKSYSKNYLRTTPVNIDES